VTREEGEERGRSLPLTALLLGHVPFRLMNRSPNADAATDLLAMPRWGPGLRLAPIVSVGHRVLSEAVLLAEERTPHYSGS